VDGDLACPHAQVKAAEVLWIGDSWILVPGAQHTRVRDLARAQAPSPQRRLRHRRGGRHHLERDHRPVQRAPGRHDQGQGPDHGRGTWDTIQTNGADATVTNVVSAFGQFLSKVRTDGTVAHVIYFLPPELASIPGVAALRPGLQQACAQSTQNKLPCYFIDLQTRWGSRASDYIDPATSNLLPTDTGARDLADAIWGVMQDNCIANDDCVIESGLWPHR